ncbi:MAG: hypothetical protein OXI50_12440 [Gammaproteobacteria bacterium]|nr:hypothetical protein [Gammaproteobacteria bacterium]
MMRAGRWPAASAGRRAILPSLGRLMLLLAVQALWLTPAGGPRLPLPGFGRDGLSQQALAAAFAAQEEISPDLLGIPGVVGTAVGLGAGERPVVMVYLEYAAVDGLPASFAGYPLVREVTGRITALGDLPLPAAAAGTIDPRGPFPRPVPIGVSTGRTGVTAGTIGARVTDGRRTYALSNNHVFANRNEANVGDNVIQPGVADGGSDPEHAFGTLADFEEIGFCRALACPENQVDGAIAETSPDQLAAATPSNGYGAPRTGTEEPSLMLAVQKYGRTTGHTRGKVTGINAILDVNYRTGRARFVDQIVITGQGFSAGGDSGSLIVTEGRGRKDRRPVGLLFAGSPNTTIANPIDVVLDRFGVTVDPG